MASFIEQFIAVEKIKLRWQETYVSEGLNKKLGNILPRGIYFGFTPSVGGVGNQHILLSVDSGINASIAIYNDKTNGFSTTVYETAQIDLDLTSVANNTTGYVVIRVSYQVSIPTSGKYAVIPTADLLPTDIIVCSFNKDGTGIITVDTTPGVNRTLPDGSDPNSLPYVFVPKNHRVNSPIDHPDGSVTAPKLSDPLNPAPEIIFGSGKRLRGEFDASAVSGEDKCHAKWGDGVGGYTRIIDMPVGSTYKTIISKNARWDGTNWYRDNNSLYSYVFELEARADTHEAIGSAFATPGTGPIIWRRYTSFRPSPGISLIYDLLLGGGKDGNQAQQLSLIKWDGSGFADFAHRGTAGLPIRFGFGWINYDGTSAIAKGIISSVRKIATGRYEYTLDQIYPYFSPVASGYILKEFVSVFPLSNGFIVLTYDTAGNPIDWHNYAIVLAIP